MTSKRSTSEFFGSTKKKVGGKRRVRETVTRTFRIDSDWDEVLQEEAGKKGVSVNTLVDQILRRYALYTRFAEKGDVISITKPTFQRILSEVSDEACERVGSDSGNGDVLDILNMIGKPISYDSWVYLVSEYLGGRGLFGWFTCYYHKRGDRDLFHLQHRLGLGWSKFLDKYLGTFLSSVIDIDFESRVYPFALNILVK